MSVATVRKIKSLMIDKKIKQKDIVEYLNEPQGTVAKWLSENEKIRHEIPLSILIKLASLLNISTDYLLGINGDRTKVKTIPIIGTTSCGGLDMNHLQEDGRVTYYNGDSYNIHLYSVIANGDSMSPEIEDGDEIVCDPNIEPQNGDMVHYTLGDESAVKIYFKDEDAFIIQFIPYNPHEHFKTKTIRLDDDEAHEVKISKVVSVVKLKFNNRSSRLKLVGKA